MKQDRFNFFIPGIEINKAKDKDGNEIMKVGGIASTAEKDTDEEYLDPSGYDTSYFLKNGFVNWDHRQKTGGPQFIIGEPTIAKITPKNEFYIEAELYPDSKLARNAYDLAKTLNNHSKTRKLGWSIEGKVLARDEKNPKIVTKALITGVAITPSPKNGGTWLDIVKGNIQNEELVYDEFEIEVEKGEEGNVLENDKNLANGGKYYILDVTKPNGDRILVDKEFNIQVITKALMATEGTGKVLKKEDVEKQLKYPNIVVKSLVTIVKAYEDGLINEERFNYIKSKIKNSYFNHNE